MRFVRFLIVIPALLLLTACAQEPGTERIGGEAPQEQPQVGGQPQQEPGAPGGGETGGTAQEKEGSEQPKG